MKIECAVYVSGNGISLRLCGETEIEIAILRGLVEHGSLEFVHPGHCEKMNPAAAIVWKFDEANESEE